MFLEQPQGNVVVNREEPASYKASLSVEELQSKAVRALGGEANLRRHRSLTLKYESAYEAQGVTGKGQILHLVPNRVVEMGAQVEF